jgi:hypothetical protein
MLFDATKFKLLPSPLSAHHGEVEGETSMD